MGQESRRVLKRYFFSNTSTLLLPFFFITLSLIIFLQQFPFFSIKGHILSGKFLEPIAIYVLLIGSVSVLFIILNKLIKKAIIPFSLEGIEPAIISRKKNEKEEDFQKKIIHREEQQDKIKEFFDKALRERKYAFLVGKSGSGKTLLVSEYLLYEKNVEKIGIEDYMEPDEINQKLKDIKEKCKAGNIPRYFIIFDQFERALASNEVFGYIIDFLRDTKYSIAVIFVCMNNDYADILKKLHSSLDEPDSTNWEIAAKNQDNIIDYKKEGK